MGGTAITHTRCAAPKCLRSAEPDLPFCAVHLCAPAPQRGGWLSADRRRRVRGGNPTAEPLDASCIARRLWVGGEPPLERDLPEFDVLVLCAEEIQPPRDQIAFHGKILHCPMPDGPLAHAELRRALATGRRVGTDLVAGKTVLVTCAMGINRSALVATLALGLVTRLSADDLIEIVRARRYSRCLSNEHFREVLQRYIGAGRRAPLGALPPAQ